MIYPIVITGSNAEAFIPPNLPSPREAFNFRFSEVVAKTIACAGCPFPGPYRGVMGWPNISAAPRAIKIRAWAGIFERKMYNCLVINLYLFTLSIKPVGIK